MCNFVRMIVYIIGYLQDINVLSIKGEIHWTFFYMAKFFSLGFIILHLQRTYLRILTSLQVLPSKLIKLCNVAIVTGEVSYFRVILTCISLMSENDYPFIWSRNAYVSFSSYALCQQFLGLGNATFQTKSFSLGLLHKYTTVTRSILLLTKSGLFHIFAVMNSAAMNIPMQE